MHHQNTLYLQPIQSRELPTTSYEDLLGDSIERCYAKGTHDLQDVVNYLNQYGPVAPNGMDWTAETFQKEMARLGE